MKLKDEVIGMCENRMYVQEILVPVIVALMRDMQVPVSQKM